MNHQSKTYYPGFQFSNEGQPLPVIGRVLAALPEQLQGWGLALWWTTPNDMLDWHRPVDLLDEGGEQIVAAAQAEARDWSQAAV